MHISKLLINFVDVSMKRKESVTLFTVLLMMFISSAAFAAPECGRVVDAVCEAYDGFVDKAADINSHDDLQEAIRQVEINTVIRGVHSDCLAYVLTTDDKDRLTSSTIDMLEAITAKLCELKPGSDHVTMHQREEEYSDFLRKGIAASYTFGDFVDLLDGRRGWYEPDIPTPTPPTKTKAKTRRH